MKLLLISVFTFTTLIGYGGTGGGVLWKVKIADRGGQAPLSIAAMGDDGVVVVQMADDIVEVVPQSEGQPLVRTVTMPGVPVARVNGRTYAYEAAGRRVSWAEGGKLSGGFQVPDQLPVMAPAISLSGDLYLTTSEGSHYYLTRWSPSGNLVFRKLVPSPIGDPFVSSPLLGVDGDVIVESRGYGTLHWFSETGELVQSVMAFGYPVAPTSTGGVIIWDDLNRLVNIPKLGLPWETLGQVNGQGGYAITPTDTILPLPDMSGGGNSPIAGLADGGTIVIHRPGIYRLSSSGRIIWGRLIAPDYPTPPRIGNGTLYLSEISREGAVLTYWLTAIDLGAPFMDSAWPSSEGWPDGSRRARARTFPAPLLTMVKHSLTAGVLIDVGIEAGQTYWVESRTNVTGLWKAVGTVTGPGFGAQFVDPTPADSTMGLYRVRSFD